MFSPLYLIKMIPQFSGGSAPESGPTSATAMPPSVPAVPSASQQQSEPAVSYPPDMRDKYRHQWFQTRDVVEIAVLAKNMTPDQVSVDIEEKKVQVRHVHNIVMFVVCCGKAILGACCIGIPKIC